MKTFLICLYLLEHSAYNLFSFQYHCKVIIKNINSCFMTLRVYWIVQSFFILNSPTGLSCVFLHSYSYFHVLYLCPLLVVTVLTVPLSILSSSLTQRVSLQAWPKQEVGFTLIRSGRFWMTWPSYLLGFLNILDPTKPIPSWGLALGTLCLDHITLASHGTSCFILLSLSNICLSLLWEDKTACFSFSNHSIS